MFSFFVERALISSTWQKSVRIDVNERGYIDSITSGSSPDGCFVLKGAMIPAVPNLHSHAFQRAMAGLTEVAGNPQDSFWTWRDQMYRLVSKMTPESASGGSFAAAGRNGWG